ncbi:hypothetical protein EJ06DRAFT_240766 [Trichodelitschia bisporula]|uniref:AA1-like domain-containing protein n=1 Tax=Trichodelitschia bisporula TaxID=703511 RepID=A0A6G1HL07_9PEZI|nr:hypothetical protein EJ06DRAFT_240766 [Trichodelitschia bisporula]
MPTNFDMAGIKIAALLLPFLLAPTLASPTGSPRHATFTLSNINYNSSMIYSTPAHLAVSEGYIDFDLENSAVPYTAHCSAYSSRGFGFFFGDQVYQCTVPAGSASFTFSQPDGVFNVNETWTQEHGHRSQDYLGTGSGSITLDCSTVVYTNPNWTIGDIYSTTTETCQPGELTIKPTVVRV